MHFFLFFKFEGIFCLTCTKENLKKRENNYGMKNLKESIQSLPPINNQVRLNVYHRTLGVARIRVEISLNQI